MFLSFFIFSPFISSLDFCVAPPTTPAPFSNANFTLRLVQLVDRHGARTPSSIFLNRSGRGYWECDSRGAFAPRAVISEEKRVRKIRHRYDHRITDFPPSCTSGELLVEGMRQHHELGTIYRKYLVDDLQFLPDYFDSSLVYVRSTNSQRTFDSAVSFLQGLYPPADPNEFVTIDAGDDGDFFRPQTSKCAELKRQDKEFAKSDMCKARVNETKQKISPMFDFLGVNYETADDGDLDEMCDFMVAAACSDKIQFPENITDDMIYQCMKFINFLMTDRYAYDSGFDYGIAASPAFRELNRLRDSAFSNTDNTKFHLISAHDSTIVSLLLLFGIRNEYPPPFASHLVFEYYVENSSHEVYLRLIYNGQEVSMFNESSFLPLDYILGKVSPHAKYCNEFE